MIELPEQRSPNRWNRALITGASSGIGLAFAKLLAAESTSVVLVSRRESDLADLAAELSNAFDIEAEILVADLADDSQVKRVADRLTDNDRPIDLLVNNAGLGFSGDLVDLDPAGEQQVIQVNVVAMHHLAHAAGSAMADRGRGGILNVSSVAGFAASPQSATYAATKAFVTSFSEALHVELEPQGVVVSCLCPGLTRTDFHRRAGYSVGAIPNVMWQSSEEVAAIGLAGIAKGKAVVVPGAKNKLLANTMKATPAPVLRRVTSALARAGER